ncbi:ferrous iron transport protein A [Ketobacter alkanivorans]|uniref:Ferrous iron transport protein A n=1 Tax=Ketobacter alkanivorans TaxID=1917421 RepID=A0A2K9LRH5_9GAMM|nr:ferrous iron transport protein A [Ketobacter alkanivorans]MCP5017560.1 ferrous iron transport protein A [Ketobacter sp.]
MNFTDLSVGDSARVLSYHGLTDSYRKKLMSMGLIPGTCFNLERVAPLGDPVEINVRGFRLSLRRMEAAGLQVERL